MSKLDQIRFPRERQFAETFFQSEDDWEYQPGPYYVDLHGKKVGFTPDFWDAKRSVLIEVVGSRQAFNYNKEKYIAFNTVCPNFEIRTYDTHALLNPIDERVKYIQPNLLPWWRCGNRERRYKDDLSWAKEELAFVLLRSGYTIAELSKEIGVSPEAISRIVYGMNSLFRPETSCLIVKFLDAYNRYPNFLEKKKSSNNKNTQRKAWRALGI